MANNALDDIVFITLPPSMNRDIGGFRIDPARPLPLQLPKGRKTLDGETEVTIEMIVSGMLKVIAYQTDNPHNEYYKAFVLAAEPDCVNLLTSAAIAQEKAAHHDFSEELFLTVNRLSPESATFINLATCYSARAAADKSKGKVYDFYAQKALNTLLEGLKMFPKDPELLFEAGFFHLYQGNSDEARSSFEKYLAVAPPGEKREKVKSVLLSLVKKIKGDTDLLEAYDHIQMNEEGKAIEKLDDYLKTNPKVWNAWFLKGWALRKSEKFEEAKKAFTRCLSLGERDADIYNELSLCEFALGNRDLAKTYLDTAVDLDGKNLTYISNLAYMHLQDREWEEARRFLEMARATDPGDPLIIDLMKDYEKETGDKLSSPIVEEVVDDSTLQEEVRKRDAKEIHEDEEHANQSEEC